MAKRRHLGGNQPATSIGSTSWSRRCVPERGPFNGFEQGSDVGRGQGGDARRADRRTRRGSIEYDAYYYSQEGMKPLPVLRIRYADPQQTWLYLDPQRGVIASRLERGSRWNRWLYHGFHSLELVTVHRNEQNREA